VGPAPLRGVADIGSVYRVVSERARHRGAHRTPLVGRDQQLELLADRWQRATEGTGQAVTIVGDAGIGKSHLIDEFLASLADTSHVVMECRCLPFYQNTALYPIVELLERELGPEAMQDPAAAKRELAAMLERDGFDVKEMLPLFGSLLDLPGMPRSSATPETRREKTRAALVRMILRAAESSPLVFVVEDLHWADPSTLELIRVLMAHVWRERMLAIFTTRPGGEPAWQGTDHTLRLDLQRLAHSDAERLIRSVAGKQLPGEVVSQIVTKTDGVPLFLEELSKMVLQSGLLEERADAWELTGPLPPLAIPDTLQDSLEARLDRLASVKEIAQLGATIGREFSCDLLREVVGVEPAWLAQALERLVEAELIWARDEAPALTYTFKHALIQEAAYESLLRSTRQRYHQRIALALERAFPAITASEPETLAHHWTAADLVDRAVPYWLRAGQKALHASAHLEAAAHLRRGLGLLERLPDSADRLQVEVELRTALGAALIATEGYASDEVKELNTRALDLCREAGDMERIVPVMAGLFAYYVVRGDLREAGQTSVDLVRVSKKRGDEALVLLADVVHGIVQVNRGELADARVTLEAVLAAYDAGRHAGTWMKYGHDPAVLAWAYLSLVQWMQGFPVQASRSDERAVAHAKTLGHPHSVAFALAFQSAHLRLNRLHDEAARVAEELLELALQRHFRLWQADALLLQAFLLTERGLKSAARERMEESLALFGTRTTIGVPYYKLLVARVHAGLGQVELALDTLAFDPARYGPEDLWWWIGEQCLLLAELCARVPGRQADAEHWLRHAMGQADRQGANSPALRTATAQARLLLARDQRAQARAVLAPRYAVLTEGHDLPDLRAAAALLRELDEDGTGQPGKGR
jgi:hypothetical protein